jgi:hypothetical protein
LDAGGAIAGGQVFFPAIEQELYGSAGLPGCQGRNDRVFAGVVLAAESTPHVVFDDAHLILAESQRLGDLIPHTVDVLGGIVQCQGIAFPQCHAAVRFQAIVQGRRGLKLALHHYVCFGKALIHVATLIDLGLSRH